MARMTRNSLLKFMEKLLVAGGEAMTFVCIHSLLFGGTDMWGLLYDLACLFFFFFFTSSPGGIFVFLLSMTRIRSTQTWVEWRGYARFSGRVQETQHFQFPAEGRGNRLKTPLWHLSGSYKSSLCIVHQVAWRRVMMGDEMLLVTVCMCWWWCWQLSIAVDVS